MFLDTVIARPHRNVRPARVAPPPAAVLRSGAALIVIEGAERLTWQRVANEQWVPVSLWPDAHQLRAVTRHLRSGAPLIVVVERSHCSVPMLADEFASAPSFIRALATERSGEVVDVDIPVLDWLPVELRARGLRFLEQTEHRRRSGARGLQPPAIIEDARSNVRFVRPVGPITPILKGHHALVEQCFPTLGVSAVLQSARAS